VGEFGSAAQTAQKGPQLAETPPNPALAIALRRELTLYEAGRPFEAAH
jgi:hypothetical protein